MIFKPNCFFSFLSTNSARFATPEYRKYSLPGLFSLPPGNIVTGGEAAKTTVPLEVASVFFNSSMGLTSSNTEAITMDSYLTSAGLISSATEAATIDYTFSSTGLTSSTTIS
jgi:hypothetical protein